MTSPELPELARGIAQAIALSKEHPDFIWKVTRYGSDTGPVGVSSGYICNPNLAEIARFQNGKRLEDQTQIVTIKSFHSPATITISPDSVEGRKLHTRIMRGFGHWATDKVCYIGNSGNDELRWIVIFKWPQFLVHVSRGHDGVIASRVLNSFKG
jgi:hypothetical protein